MVGTAKISLVSKAYQVTLVLYSLIACNHFLEKLNQHKKSVMI